jgi:hypothetical protein
MNLGFSRKKIVTAPRFFAWIMSGQANIITQTRGTLPTTANIMKGMGVEMSWK